MIVLDDGLVSLLKREREEREVSAAAEREEEYSSTRVVASRQRIISEEVNGSTTTSSRRRSLPASSCTQTLKKSVSGAVPPDNVCRSFLKEKKWHGVARALGNLQV